MSVSLIYFCGCSAFWIILFFTLTLNQDFLFVDLESVDHRKKSHAIWTKIKTFFFFKQTSFAGQKDPEEPTRVLKNHLFLNFFII